MRLHKGCCTVKLSTVKFNGLMRPKAFYNLSLTCDKLPGLELNRYILMRSCIWLPFLRVRLWLAKLELHRMARKVSKFIQNQGL